VFTARYALSPYIKQIRFGFKELRFVLLSAGGRLGESVLIIATHHGLDGPEIESWWEGNFSHPPTPALGPTQPPVPRVPALCPGVKRPGRGVDHPPPSSAEVKERVEL
jgi:hypothetical protein